MAMRPSISSTTHTVAWSGMVLSLKLGDSGRHDSQRDSPSGRFREDRVDAVVYTETSNMVVMLVMALDCLEMNKPDRTV